MMDSLVSWDSFWCAGKAREKACLQTLTVLHVPGDPLQKDDLDSKLDILRYLSISTFSAFVGCQNAQSCMTNGW